MSVPYFSVKSALSEEIEKLKKERDELITKVQALEEELFKYKSKEVPHISAEAEKLLKVLEVFENNYPDVNKIARVFQTTNDPTLPTTPEGCKRYLKELKKNLSYKICGRYRRLSILSEDELNEVYAKLRNIFEKNPEKAVWTSPQVRENRIAVTPLIKKMYNLSEDKYLVVWTKENPVYISFEWSSIVPDYYERYEQEKFEELMEGDVILLDPNSFRTIFGEEPKNDREIKNFYLRPMQIDKERKEASKLLLNLEVYMPYDDPSVIPDELYKDYARKLLELLKNKDEATLREIVDKSMKAGLRRMSYVIPKLAIDMLDGKVYESENRPFEMSQDVYSPESYSFLYLCFSSATPRVSQELKKFLSPHKSN